MKAQSSLNHTVWECKYHIVWIPKYRKKTIYKDLSQYLGATFKELASMGRKKNFTGQSFWARGYHVSTLGG